VQKDFSTVGGGMVGVSWVSQGSATTIVAFYQISMIITDLI
jgi:hypothetical protein